MGTIAEKLNYLNTTKANIKNAIIEKGVSVSDNDTFRSYASKIADIEPTLGTKTITANGTYTASDDSLQGYSSVTVDIDDTDLYRDTTDSTYESVKTLSNCGAFPMLSLTAEINAVQDLHGYDHPWVGGAGKNKLPMTLDGMKASNTTGTWSGNTYAINGGTLTVSTDDGGNVTDITVNGTFNAQTEFRLTNPSNLDNSFYGYILNGSPVYPNDNVSLLVTYIDDRMWKGDQFSYNGADTTINQSFSTIIFSIIVRSGTSVTDKVFHPMIRLSAETDPTFESYSNICPISGWDSIDVCQSGVNTSNPTTYTTALSTTCYGGSKDIKGNERFTHGHIASYNGETLPSTWISDRDEYAEGTTPTIGAEVVYELATPTTATSDAIDLTLAEGVNNIWADSGNVGDARYFRKVEL